MDAGAVVREEEAAALGPHSLPLAAGGEGASSDSGSEGREAEDGGGAAGPSGAGSGGLVRHVSSGLSAGLSSALQQQHLENGGAGGPAGRPAAGRPAAPGGAEALVEGAGPASPAEGAAGRHEGGGPAAALGAEPGPGAAPQRGSFPFTLSVQNQYGPRWPVPLLERVEFTFQVGWPGG